MRPGRGPFRLPRGGRLDRSAEISFGFNGKTYTGFSGDTLASAILANGIRIVGRSLKFHRPRGVLSCGSEEPNAVVQLGVGADTLPAARAPLIELAADLSARSVSGWPSVQFDLFRCLDFTASLWAAGFYNKTFIWPSWHRYERFIRHMAGLGAAPTSRDPHTYATRNLYCDVLVVGGGVAGLEAALNAAQGGARVVLAEEASSFGGQSTSEDVTISPGAPRADIVSMVQRLRGFPDVRLFVRTSATGFYDHQVVALLERAAVGRVRVPRERYWLVRAQRVVLATGVIEQPLIFDNNDRPGIMLAGAAHQYLRRYAISIGSRVLIATNNDLTYDLAADLKQAGVGVLAVADTRECVPQPLHSAMQALEIPLLLGTIPINTAGFSALRRVRLGRLNKDQTGVTSSRWLTCDALAVSGGFSPALQLFAQAGGKLVFDGPSGALLPVAPIPGIEIRGAASHVVPTGPRVSPVGNPQRKWVDLMHDVTVADLELALRENYISVEHVKRYTTVGMAADQGKTSTVVTLGVLSEIRKVAPQDLGHTTLRPPVTPVTLGAIVGQEKNALFAPYRRLPLHDWHAAHGGVLQDFGEWARPVAYLRSDENRDGAIRREASAVRSGAGLLDGSSLGKIEILGPDALRFLDYFYINDLTTLKPYRARYGLMLRETGGLFDDGTVVMRTPNHLLVTTTSGNAGRVGLWLEEWRQCEWPSLRIAILPVTECWATVSLTGPKARGILSRLPTDIDLSASAFPYLGVREGKLMGVPARIYRVSFTGELTYEINVPANKAQLIWDALLEVGTSEQLGPVGLDALMLLRLEKGFLHLGTDTDGTTVPDDVGWGTVAANKKADFIGKRSLQLPEHLRADRLQLIGLKGEGPDPLVIGSHLRVRDSREPTDGWITSAGRAVLSGDSLALAMLRAGRSRIGEIVDVYDAGARNAKARVVQPPFYDVGGDRIHD